MNRARFDFAYTKLLDRTGEGWRVVEGGIGFKDQTTVAMVLGSASLLHYDLILQKEGLRDVNEGSRSNEPRKP